MSNIKKALKRFIKNLYQAGINLVNHDGIEHAGYMAFLSIVSLFPFIVFIVAIIGEIGGTEIGRHLINFIYENQPKNISIEFIEPRIKEIILGPPQSLLTLAVFGAIWTASSSVEGMRTILNRIYAINTPPAYIWRRLLSIVQFLFLTILIIVTIILLIIVPSTLGKISSIIMIDDIFSKVKIFKPFWGYGKYFISELLLFLVVSTIYYIVPNLKLKIREIIPGALLVAISWSGAGSILSLYLKHFRQVNLIYGSLAGVIAILLLFYIMNLILIYGAELNYLFKNNK